MSDGESGPTAEFLDQHQYERDDIEAYEKVYGPDFVSTGGETTARRLAARLDLAAGERVLDVGCGLGGSAFLMAREYGVEVDGVDLSRNMIALANQRLARHDLGGAVRIRHGDCLQLEIDRPYDVVYSRDVFLHIPDKPRLFAALREAMRPGGRFLFTDYCRGPGPYSEAFEAYRSTWGYDLRQLDEYREVIEAAGFEEVGAEDLSAMFVEVHEAELARMGEAGLDEAHLAELREGWQAKIERATRGEQVWGLFWGRRPAEAS